MLNLNTTSSTRNSVSDSGGGMEMSVNLVIKSRLVRCPHCCLIFPEPHNFCVYKCGGCGTILQTKNNKRIAHRRGFTSVHFFWHIFGLFVIPIHSFICKISKSWVCKLLECQQRALALCFFVMEATSVLLDTFGKNKLPFLLVAFRLSAFSFALTLYVSIKDRTKVQAERQMKVVEIVFSLIQLVVTFLQVLLTVVDVKNNSNVSVYALAFAIIAVVFVLWEDKKVTGVLLVSPQTIDSMPSTSTQIDLRPLNFLTMRCNAGTDVEQANRQVNDHDIRSRNIEKKKNNNNDYYKLSIEEERELKLKLAAYRLEFYEMDRLLRGKDDKHGGGGDDDDNNGGGGDDNDYGGGDDGSNGSGGGKNEKKDGSDGNGNGNGNNDKGEGSDSGSSNSGNTKRKKMKPLFGCKFGYHAGNENRCPVGQLQCI